VADPNPPRIGDDDRNKAVELLSDHLNSGRLTQGELNDRLSLALQARSPDELEQLFEDLPGANPGRREDLESLEDLDRRQMADDLERHKTQRSLQARVDPKWLAALGVASGLAWTMCVIIYFSVFSDWKIFVVPLALTIALVKVRGSVR
jgi:hypothetical protein